MTATAWLFLGVVAVIILSIPVLERWQRNLDERERQSRQEHARYMREVRRQPPTIGPRRHGGQP
jgi:hypothetical protein